MGMTRWHPQVSQLDLSATNPPSTPTVETTVPTISTPVPTIIKSRGGLRYSQPPSIYNVVSSENRVEDFFGDSTHATRLNEVEDESKQYGDLKFKLPMVIKILCFHTKVYNNGQAMDGLTKAPAWYGTLSKYLLDNGFQRGTIDQTLFIRKHKGEFLLVQVYVDDIIFGSSNPKLCREFEALMHDKFKMSAMGELNLRSMIGSLMYLTASRPDIMFVVCACARHQVTPKECHLYAVKRIFSDYGGASQDSQDRGSASGCGQVLWIQNQLLDYGYNFMNTKIFIDNNSAIYDNVADLLTKAFDVGRFQYSVVSIGMLDP
ncbi:putative ribonuclease H-like domain-containing protein [Tanacetum coccineum]|uniref:Ribonuclease H-like domain-containing protein n=1 Tax=Tanacetum coccineum TaxID=301880 RepID=A0ABQ5FN37_9ASTR